MCIFAFHGSLRTNLLTITNRYMTEQKQAFEKRELRALLRELLKPFVATIPEIGNQENAFNDA